jgi:hypothetical protein
MKEPICGIRKYVFVIGIKAGIIQQKSGLLPSEKEAAYLEIKKPRIVRRGT